MFQRTVAPSPSGKQRHALPVGRRAVMTSSSPAHQITPDLRSDRPSAFVTEPPEYLLHRWDGGALVGLRRCWGSPAFLRSIRVTRLAETTLEGPYPLQGR
jgi:hypothetical protein